METIWNKILIKKEKYCTLFSRSIKEGLTKMKKLTESTKTPKTPAERARRNNLIKSIISNVFFGGIYVGSTVMTGMSAISTKKAIDENDKKEAAKLGVVTGIFGMSSIITGFAWLNKASNDLMDERNKIEQAKLDCICDKLGVDGNKIVETYDVYNGAGIIEVRDAKRAAKKQARAEKKAAKKAKKETADK